MNKGERTLYVQDRWANGHWANGILGELVRGEKFFGERTDIPNNSKKTTNKLELPTPNDGCSPEETASVN